MDGIGTLRVDAALDKYSNYTACDYGAGILWGGDGCAWSAYGAYYSRCTRLYEY